MDNKAMFKISYGLYLLTAADGGKDNGCITNTAVQVTSTPNRVSITVSKSNLTHEMIVNSGIFNLTVLTVNTPFSVFENYGYRSGRTIDKFAAQANIKRSENGLIYLPDYGNAVISAKVTDTVDAGTHTIFIADVTDCSALSEAESVTYEYYHNKIKPAPADNAKKGYRCRICGYVYEGEPLPPDYICPICKHGADDFDKL